MDWGEEQRKVEEKLAQEGWKKVSEFYSQGVVSLNFEKEGLAIHLEYGEKDCVFGEVKDDTEGEV